MNNTNSGMPSFNFIRTSANPSDLKPHHLLEELGYANKSDEQYAKMMAYFGQYDSPVKDRDNNVITHWADVQAAVENCITAMECYTVDMTINQLRQFILLKHKYNVKNLIASFKTVQFYEDYLANDAAGIQLSASLIGSTREKIALLMHTSDSTIKRLKEVGENKPDKLGLIDQGYTSFKQVTGEIKAERLAAASAANKLAIDNEPILPENQEPVKEYYTQPETDEAINIPTDLVEPAETSYYKDTPAIPAEPSNIEGEEKDKEYYDETADDDIHNAEQIDFTNGVFTIAGLGRLEISVTDNVPSVKINGASIKNMSYMPVLNRESETGVAQSFIISQPGKKGMSIQLTIENFSKAA